MFQRREVCHTGERGYVMIIVLIALVVGSFSIPPTLKYVSTGMNAARVSEDQLLNEYAAEGGVEYGLWQLAYNVGGIVDSLTVENPVAAATVTVNGIDVPTTIEISLSGEGGEPGPLPPTESGLNAEAVLQVDTGWAPAGQWTDFGYVVHARNYGTSQITLKGLLQILPPDFEYIDGSYTGPDAVLTKTFVTDHWELDWDFTSPLPKVDSETSSPIPFSVRGFLPTGSFSDFGTGFLYYSAFGSEEVLQAGSLFDQIAIGLYDITTQAGNQTAKANAGIFESGAALNSYTLE